MDKYVCHSCGGYGVIEEKREDEIYYMCPSCGHVENSAEYLKQLLTLLEKTIKDFYAHAIEMIDNADEKNMDAWVEKHRYHSSRGRTNG